MSSLMVDLPSFFYPNREVTWALLVNLIILLAAVKRSFTEFSWHICHLTFRPGMVTLSIVASRLKPLSGFMGRHIPLSRTWTQSTRKADGSTVCEFKLSWYLLETAYLNEWMNTVKFWNETNARPCQIRTGYYSFRSRRNTPEDACLIYV